MLPLHFSTSSPLFFLKMVRSRVSCEHGEPRDARLVSRCFAAPRCRSWAKSRHVTTDTIQEVQWLSRLSKHIYLNGKDLFINL